MSTPLDDILKKLVGLEEGIAGFKGHDLSRGRGEKPFDGPLWASADAREDALRALLREVAAKPELDPEAQNGTRDALSKVDAGEEEQPSLSAPEATEGPEDESGDDPGEVRPGRQEMAHARMMRKIREIEEQDAQRRASLPAVPPVPRMPTHEPEEESAWWSFPAAGQSQAGGGAPETTTGALRRLAAQDEG